MTALTTPVKLGGYVLILLVVLAAGFGLGRAFGAGTTGRDGPVRHAPAQQRTAPPIPHSQHPEEQPS
ncbi:hypothetical protein [Streptomyces halobius]|uniref:Uncharacterized protein n=1 Tax=Streptomyces halobius TaxID=2879846 RepID=A0ABY4M5Y4_9ACTN|nr:hypothetical protein [Streptomyces halobius]UQA93169.1 hypothetical protein K9S39_16135 [Streptomyces halobius]